MNRLLLASLCAAAAAPAAFAGAQIVPTTAQASPKAPAPRPFVAAEARETVEKLATALDENFVFPEAGKSYAAALRAKLASGGYDEFESAEAFAAAVTEDLQRVHADGHLRLHPPMPEGQAEPRRMGGPSSQEAIERAGWIAKDVAYIAFNGFPGDDATLTKLRQFLAAHDGAKTLIVDARTHRGGGLAEMDAMFPYFFAKPQTLVQMDTRVAAEDRHGSPMPDGPTLMKVSGPDGVYRRSHKVVPAAQATALRTAKIYLLTSGRTASAAEHLALSLKRTGRAVLIGEVTAGAGHYGGMVPLPGGYRAFIPVGRTFDPDNNQGWEGAGVKPDIEVPADRALAEALIRSGVSAGEAERLAAEFRPSGSMERRPRR